MYNFILEIAFIGSETGSCCTETKYGIFHYRGSVPHAFKEMCEMLHVLVVSVRGTENRIVGTRGPLACRKRASGGKPARRKTRAAVQSLPWRPADPMRSTGL